MMQATPGAQAPSFPPIPHDGHCHVNIGLAAWNQSDDLAPIMRRTGRSSPAAKY
jgi:hypothetical protein